MEDNTGENFKKILKIIATKIATAIGIKVLLCALLIILLVIFIIIFFIGAGGSDEAEGIDNGNSSSSSNSKSYLPTGWWWPIGSEETINEGSKVFAAGTPTLLGDKVLAVGKNGGSKWNLECGPHGNTTNIGLDIHSDGKTNKNYVTSVGKGKVTQVVDNISEGSNGNSGLRKLCYC